MPHRSVSPVRIAVIGGGPAGLMAAETLLAGGARVELYDAMPSVGRKFLLAGKGGLNLTHAEPAATFRARYAERQPEVSAWLDRLDADGLRAWAGELGIGTFVGSSGKVFPAEMKAAPLLRAWLHRLRVAGLTLHMRHRWNGALVPATEPGASRWQLTFDAPAGPQTTTVDAVVLALGGASWARLGSDGAWQPWLAGQGVDVRPLAPSNCGFDITWSEHLQGKQAGAPLKGVRLTFTDRLGRHFSRLGEAVVSADGIEGNLVYAASALLRDEIAANGHADLHLDLLPAKDLPTLTTALAKGRGARSMPNHLKEQAGLTGVKAALLREGLDAAQWTALCSDPAALANRIKALPLRLTAPRPIDEAISSAGGVRLEAMDAGLMLAALPGVFCAGEMLDWEAPTGGYLLTACFASGRVAGQGALDWWGAATQVDSSP
ncbi:TIGR03862 family flavoprotein [Sphaerotilus sp.]|uniref:TIGR03862 family flavoprotein n=1 Tax=Sphaerotilus sp. TaxID=2093942 RepID=UPI0034E1A042